MARIRSLTDLWKFSTGVLRSLGISNESDLQAFLESLPPEAGITVSGGRVTYRAWSPPVPGKVEEKSEQMAGNHALPATLWEELVQHCRNSTSGIT
jgi:hypothetical protein